MTHPQHQWLPGPACLSPPQGSQSLKSHMLALLNCLCPPVQGQNKPSAGGRGYSRGFVFTVNMVGRGAVASELDRLPVHLPFPEAQWARGKGWHPLLTRAVCSQAWVPAPEKHMVGHEQRLAPASGGLSVLPPLSERLQHLSSLLPWLSTSSSTF